MSVVISDRHRLDLEVLLNAPGRTIPELVKRLHEAFGRSEAEVRRVVQRKIQNQELRLDEKMVLQDGEQQ